uniref:Uncharacterized protein n=1 Tax=Romanomermis culicivorax TaxID=13658 RepID=A0A915IQK8_ROMCU
MSGALPRIWFIKLLKNDWSPKYNQNLCGYHQKISCALWRTSANVAASEFKAEANRSNLERNICLVALANCATRVAVSKAARASKLALSVAETAFRTFCIKMLDSRCLSSNFSLASFE